ncbi:wax ester/triacylglycerol synthase domain-containing protein [Micromonospora sp. HM5-17]|jgi:WS/DGAT/MGAT family acyltransferase|uniref:wax ester/triacylglycerol synthase domain-containing protein n=1 Tax=Micromonospora sp. HM5-17 TaxID=2487710 RepID=UPI000F47A5BE|nr:wax ester/triacylglycerol synthase domain-containing protein [Micromonospora sp. HM5-17]ROT29387.1 DUF1298 domain-containing protein [Micromonospora sp. HM5-17]
MTFPPTVGRPASGHPAADPPASGHPSADHPPTDRPAGPAIPGATPRRVLMVSADIGGGHHATGRALQERVLELWPGSQVRWLDTLDVMGPGVGAAFRRIYITNVEVTPWLYEFFYSSLWRYPWLARASKAFTGSWAGRRLASRIEIFDPDLIISTYPLGSAGLAWLRQHRGLGVPIGAWVSDFAPHPFWVYPQLDLNLVVHPRAVPLADAAAPGAPVAVCAPPVLRRFHPGDRDDARRRLGLDPTRYVVVVACGSFGFGAVEEAVRGLCTLTDPVQVVVVCAQNRRLVDRLNRLCVSPDRLTVLGWVDDMPALLRAADLLITNAGGATALEAWATGTPMLMYRPIAAHGAANAALMTACGLTETYQSLPDLVRRVRWAQQVASARPHPGPEDDGLAELGLLALAATAAPPPAPDRATGSVAVPERVAGTARPGPAGVPPVGRPRRRRPPPSWPLRAQDAFFLHVQSATVAQQIGAVLDLDPRPDGSPVGRDDIVDLLRRRLPALTTLRRRLSGRGRFRRPGWVIDPGVDPSEHVAEHRVPAGGGDVDAVVNEFWSQPLALHRPLWRILLVTGLAGGRTRLAIKLHHSLGDGLSVIGTLQRLLDPETGGPAPTDQPIGADRRATTDHPPGTGQPGETPDRHPAPRRPAHAGQPVDAPEHRPATGRATNTGQPAGTASRTVADSGPESRRRALAELVRTGARRGGLVVRGLARLATAGRAPHSTVNGPLRTPGRALVVATVPTDDLRRAAREYGAHVSELMCSLVAEALDRTYRPRATSSRLRAMFAVSLDPRNRARTYGNWTGAVALDLPLGRLTRRQRTSLVRDQLRRSVSGGQPIAAALVMRAMGLLPSPVHGMLARQVYNSRFMNVIVSYMSGGNPRPQRLAGAPLRRITPVVALAEGVPIGIGVLRWGETTNVGVLLDESLAETGPEFVAALQTAVAELRSEWTDQAPAG